MPTEVKSRALEQGGVTMLTLDQKAEILETVDRQVTKGKRPISDCVRALAKKFGKNEVTVWRYLKRMRSTTDMARTYLRAKSMVLARRIVEKADVEQAIEILQNPAIGVLEAPSKGQTASGLFISISADNCGAVNIGSVGPKAVDPPPDPLDATLEDYAWVEGEVVSALESKIAECVVPEGYEQT